VPNGANWTTVLAGVRDADEDVIERGEGWEFRSPLG
jgi:hypothetical protein